MLPVLLFKFELDAHSQPQLSECPLVKNTDTEFCICLLFVLLADSIYILGRVQRELRGSYRWRTILFLLPRLCSRCTCQRSRYVSTFSVTGLAPSEFVNL